MSFVRAGVMGVRSQGTPATAAPTTTNEAVSTRVAARTRAAASADRIMSPEQGLIEGVKLRHVMRVFIDVGSGDPDPRVRAEAFLRRVDTEQQLGVDATTTQQRPECQRSGQTDDVGRSEPGG